VSGLPAYVAEAITALLAVTDTLTRLEPADVDGPQAAVVSAAIAEVTSRLGVTSARMLPVVEADGLWAVGGAKSFAQWVACNHRLGLRAARQQVRLGRALRDDLPATAQAAAAGAISVEHANVLARLGPTTERRRAVLADREDACNEAFLVRWAAGMAVDGFTTMVRHWAAVADPDADDRGYVEAAEREHLHLSRLGEGYKLDGWLTVEHGQILQAALRAATPVPAADDQRTPAQRRAQALGDLGRVFLERGLAGTGRTVRPRINVLISYAQFTALAEAAAHRVICEQGSLPGLTETALIGGRAWDGNGDAGDGDSGGGRAGPSDPSPACAQFEDGTPIPRALLDRLACDSEITRIIFGPHSQVLDVGRAERTFTGPRRDALIARDKHCRFPTCTAPPPLSEGHHVKHWRRDHGPTSVAKGILLCYHHHDLVHRKGIEIERRGDTWVFIDRHGREITDDMPPRESA